MSPSEHTLTSTANPTTRRNLVLIGVVLSLAAVLLGSIRFARYDWTGIPIDRAPTTSERQVGPDCLEQIRPYTTESGRVIEPIVVDEQQYLDLVQYYRGVDRADLQSVCLYDPFTNRSGMSWIAHWWPVEEGLAIALTNVVMLLAGIWLVLAAMRAQRLPPRAIALAGAIYAVSWNTFYFGSGLLIETGIVAAIALCWYLLQKRWVWFIWPILLLGYPIKETIGIMVPVMWAWSWKEFRAGRSSALAAALPSAAATVAFGVGVLGWRRLLPEPDASWEVLPDLADVVNNLTDVVSLGSFAVGVLPLLVLAFLRWGQLRREDGWIESLLDPAVIGVVVTLGICSWSFITVDLTPRLFWMAYPFAATLAAQWFATGRAREWADGLPFLASLSPRRAGSSTTV
jgi:hypothetical protein